MLETFLTTVRVRAGPSISTEKVEKYCEGVIVRYDSTVENEGRLWISHMGIEDIVVKEIIQVNGILI